MSFYAALKNTPSKVFAQTESLTKLILIPVENLPTWVKEYPEFNELFYNQFNLRYFELLETISHLLLDKMDKRLYDLHKKKTNLIKNNAVKITHGQLANELGTAREVVSRVLKKLETEDKVEQQDGFIKIIG